MRGNAEKRTAWRPFPADDGRIVPFDRLRRVDRDDAAILDLVARERRIPALLLLHTSRCAADVAEARQVAMYLMHVVLQRTYSEVGIVFGRDRTTVSHACAHIEDLREAPAFDQAVTRLEAAIRGRRGAAAEVRHATR